MLSSTLSRAADALTRSAQLLSDSFGSVEEASRALTFSTGHQRIHMERAVSKAREGVSTAADAIRTLNADPEYTGEVKSSLASAVADASRGAQSISSALASPSATRDPWVIGGVVSDASASMQAAAGALRFQASVI